MQRIYGVHDSENTAIGTSENVKKKPRLDFDLNEPYVEGNSSVSETAKNATTDSPTVGHGQEKTNQAKDTLASPSVSKAEGKTYIYRPRKPVDQLSQNKMAIESRRKLARIREGKAKVTMSEHLEKQKQRMKPRLEKDKRDTERFGFSVRPRNVRDRYLREKIRLGIATEDEHNFVKIQKQKASSYPSQKRRRENLKLIGARIRAGNATEEDKEILNRHNRIRRESYQRRKNSKAD
ncbi:uncharacterized protein FA14DRAFT_185760 [Meira miltonrushii]|uniref:Uncharacterized protein n=1 Tax=Meira miltonrushii TaxID=1280837 RepID=A0A316V901_9BASI|nr:uncharacterized protein FA14DRAFT_185760 [Meira miltonrushii]PWN32941.1 hypothetical protein FA14DRAFT_185760 [Meira miltonrushii]